MDRFLIRGGTALSGAVETSGAKNAALPQLAAALLTPEPVVLRGVPELKDIDSMLVLLEHLGAEVHRAGDMVEIRAAAPASAEAPYDLVRKMRASVLVLGPLIARLGNCRVSLPGGCAIGSRPVDQHVQGLRRLGGELTVEQGYLIGRDIKLHGGEVVFERVTVTGTENVLMAAALAAGVTVMRNCAMEPEVVDLGLMLNKMGARIIGLGTPTITVEGAAKLGGAEHRVLPDRIEAGTYLTAGLITGGEVEVRDCHPEQMSALINRLADCQAELEVGPDFIRTMPSRMKAVGVTTAPYPGFPTDMQAQFMALMTQAEGTAVVTETIFENRFMHVPELNRMGADIRIDRQHAVVTGARKLSGAGVMATDLRASASLVLAGLVAAGETLVNRVYHIDRGYSHIVRKLRNLGADIERIHS